MSGRVGPLPPSFINTYSLDFDGVDDNVYLQNLTSRKVQTLTMSVWVKPTAFARDGIVLNGHTSYGNQGIEIYWNFNQFAVRINGTIQGLGAGNGQNNWTHVAIAYDGNTLKRMVNGVPNTDVVIGQAINYTNYNGLVLGRSPYGFHIGNIDEFAFWDSDQSANFSTIYNNGIPNNLSSLNPLSWYRMGDNGTYKSPQWLIPSNENKDKVSNYSFEFDGVDDYIDLGSSSTVADGGQFSLSFWIKGTSQSAGAKYLFSADYYNLNTYWTIQNTELYWRNINNNYKLLSTNLLDGEWHHILIIWNPDGANSTIRCFTDGVNEVNIATDFRYAPGWNGGAYQGGLQYIGNRGGGTFPGFNGSINEFAVWDNDQSSNVLDIYNGGKPTTISGAISHWKLGENATFLTNWTVPDEVGINDGTSANMTIEDRVGTAPSSSNNALSFNMESVDRVTDVPT